MRYLSGRGVTLSHTFYDDETPLTVPSCAVTVTNDLGTVVVTNQAAAATDAQWSVTLAPLPLGRYTVSWVATGYTDTTDFEIVGDFLFSLKDARDSDEDLDATRFPTAKLRSYRDIVEDEFERITARSFTPRVRVLSLTADGSDTLFSGLYDVSSVVSVSGPAALDPASALLVAADWSVTSGSLLVAPEDIPVGTVLTVKVQYGLESVPPDVAKAGMTRLRHYLVAEKSAIPERATGFNSADGGYFQLATAGRNGWETGLPDVDAVLKRYRYDVIQAVMAGAY